MPDPISYGAPIGQAFGPSQAPSTTPDPTRPQVTRASDAQVKAAYQAYMRQVVQAAHEHFLQGLAAQRAKAAQPAAPAHSTSMSDLLRLGQNARGEQIDRTVENIESGNPEAPTALQQKPRQ